MSAAAKVLDPCSASRMMWFDKEDQRAIFGDIRDEHDALASGVRPKPDGSYLVDGTVPIRDLNRTFDWTLPDEEANTIAGLVIHEARTIPDVGQVFIFHGFRFEVVTRRENRVTRLKMRPI